VLCKIIAPASIKQSNKLTAEAEDRSSNSVALGLTHPPRKKG
jgi:hypothetical protein